MLRGRATTSARTSPTTTNGAIVPAISIVRPAREPAPQKRMRSNAAGSSRVMPCETPPSTAPSATPARVSRTGVAPPRPCDPIAYTATVATTAPANANQMNDPMSVSPRNATASTTANAAPALTPRMPGSARGLRVMAWMRAPETPSAVPTSSPTTVRGRRRSRMITWSPEPS